MKASKWRIIVRLRESYDAYFGGSCEMSRRRVQLKKYPAINVSVMPEESLKRYNDSGNILAQKAKCLFDKSRETMTNRESNLQLKKK